MEYPIAFLSSSSTLIIVEIMDLVLAAVVGKVVLPTSTVPRVKLFLGLTQMLISEMQPSTAPILQVYPLM